jgi:hypothetical protein
MMFSACCEGARQENRPSPANAEPSAVEFQADLVMGNKYIDAPLPAQRRRCHLATARHCRSALSRVNHAVAIRNPADLNSCKVCRIDFF